MVVFSFLSGPYFGHRFRFQISLTGKGFDSRNLHKHILAGGGSDEKGNSPKKKAPSVANRTLECTIEINKLTS